MNQPLPSNSPTALAINEFRTAHNSFHTPDMEDITPDMAAAAVVGTWVSITGIEAELSTLTRNDLHIFTMASACLDNMGAWIRCDVVGYVADTYGTERLTEIADITGKSIKTLANDYTTYKAWPKHLRSPLRPYTVHQALNVLSEDERPVWLERATSEGWSARRTRWEVSQHLETETPKDSQRWEEMQSRLDWWQEDAGVTVVRSDTTVKLYYKEDIIQITAELTSTGRPIVKME